MKTIIFNLLSIVFVTSIFASNKNIHSAAAPVIPVFKITRNIYDNCKNYNTVPKSDV